MRRAVLLSAAVAVALALLALPFVSGASHNDPSDPNDVRGPLDVRLISVRDSAPPRYKVGTYGKWRLEGTWDRGFVVIKFDTFGDAHFDYYALIRSDGHITRGSLWRDYARRSDRVIALLETGRPSRRSVAVHVRFGKMRFREPMSYRWTATTTWTSRRCPAVCLDRVPQKGAFTEPEPIVPTPVPSLTNTNTPRPSRSPSPSPSPSESERPKPKPSKT